ncbi:MAG: protein kinase domain-containing protein [Nannocystaceae bacterium]|nr:tetratricopeptide repeat protein [bacterium]
MASPPTPTVPLGEDQTPVEDATPSRESLTPGTRVGRYLIVEKIGEGGAGAVYAAFDAKLDRKVALKLLQHGNGGGPLSTLDPRWPKLVQEARMLAKLSDPEVVTVFDVGEFEGLGYLAMELVRGGDLAEWIERHRGVHAREPRPLHDALALMRQAGEGLACAHRAGLVHGDFKPANVLIDAKGRAKVSDFGIARLHGGADVPSSQMTTSPGDDPSVDASSPRADDTARGARWVGTPAFMAPEQFDGELPTEQTDVYAYCTALFQAVYGVLPWSAASLLELSTLKAHRPPHRPSSVRVPRWLDRLLDRGLAVDPSDRFATMDAVLAALRRGLGGRRRKGVVVAVTIAVAGASAPLWMPQLRTAQDGLLCETDGFGWDTQAQQRVRDAFDGLGHRAPQEAWTRVDTRMQSLATAWADAWEGACHATGSPSLQRQSLACLQRQRRQADALVDAWTDGEALGVELVDRASRAATALAEPSDCLEPSRLGQGDRLPADAELAAAVSEARAHLDEAVALSRAGRVKDALPKAKVAMAAAEDTAFGPVLAEASLVLGRTLERAGDIEGSAEALERAYFEGVSAEAPALVAEAASRLVWVVGARLEKHDEGMLWAQHAGASLEKTGGRRDQLMTNVAGLLERKGAYAESEAKLKEALGATPQEEAYDLGIVHQRLGDVLRRQGKTDAAIEHYQQTIALWTEALGASHPNVAIAKSSWASGLSRAGRTEEAERAFREALAELEAAFGSEHPTVSAALQNLGITLKNQRKFEEAEAVFRRAASIDAAVFGPEHMKTADRREALGRLLTRRGKGAEALVEHEAAGKVYAEALEPGHPWRILNLLNVGDALRQMQAPRRAVDAYAAAHDAARDHLKADDPLRADTAAYYGRALVEAERYSQAAAVLGPALRSLRAVEGYEDVEAIAGWALARAQVETGGDVAEAVTLATASREGLAGWPEEQAALDAWVDAHGQPR